MLKGTNGVAGAVLASTTTSVCVFIPMIFLTGIIGKVLKTLSLALVLCLSASLLAALFIVPILAKRGLLRSTHQGGGSSTWTRFIGRLEHSYSIILSRSLKMPGMVVFTSVAVLVMSVFAASLLGLSFIPAADYGEIFLSLELPPGSTLDDGVDACNRVEALISEEFPEVKETVFFVGMENELSGESRRREAVWSQLLLEPGSRRKRDFREIIDALNEQIPAIVPGTTVAVFNGGFDRIVSIAADGAGYRVELSSESWEKLKTAARRIEAILDSDPDIRSTNWDVTEDRRYVSAVLDREMLDQLGVSASEAAMTARIAWEGVEAGDYRWVDGEDRPIRLTTTLEGTSPGSKTLSLVKVPSASGRMAAFESVASIQENLGISGIRRRNRARVLTVVGYAGRENVRGISRRLKIALEADPLDKAVDWRIKGVGGLINDSINDLSLVLIVSLFLVYAVMAIQFERLLQPLIIMGSVPFCFIGVVGGLALFGSDFSLISFLGIATLGGLVVNNAIVLVDRFNRLQQEGISLNEAVIIGSVTRLRPILMTTLTTFFGTLPLALGQGTGARVYAPLGQAIAGGLVSSTLVTLFLIPNLYRIVEARRNRRLST